MFLGVKWCNFAHVKDKNVFHIRHKLLLNTTKSIPEYRSLTTNSTEVDFSGQEEGKC